MLSASMIPFCLADWLELEVEMMLFVLDVTNQSTFNDHEFSEPSDSILLSALPYHHV